MGGLKLQKKKNDYYNVIKKRGKKERKVQKSSMGKDRSKDRQLNILVHYPPSVIITFTYTIPLIELTYPVRPIRRRNIYFSNSDWSQACHIQVSTSIFELQSYKNPSTLRSLGACNNKRTRRGRGLDNLHSFGPTTLQFQ